MTLDRHCRFPRVAECKLPRVLLSRRKTDPLLFRRVLANHPLTVFGSNVAFSRVRMDKTTRSLCLLQCVLGDAESSQLLGELSKF